MRFDQIYSWLEVHKPKVILEVGTWNGGNAVRMMEAACAEKYIGFDVWDEGSKELDELELNVKKHVTKKSVEKLFDSKGFEYELIQGNTRVTMPEYMVGGHPIADFSLIDGGHSAATIHNDFVQIMRLTHTKGTIFFDDYYIGITENSPVGANPVLANIKAPYTVYPQSDPVYLNGDKEPTGKVKIVRMDMRDIKITDRWDVPEEESWSFSPSSLSG